MALFSTRHCPVSARTFRAVGHTCLSSEKKPAYLISVLRPLLTVKGKRKESFFLQLTFKDTGVGSGSRALMCPPGLRILYLDMQKGRFNELECEEKKQEIY